MHHELRNLHSLFRLLRKLLVNSLSSTVKRLLLQWTLAAVNWTKGMALRALSRNDKLRRPETTTQESPNDGAVICYSQEPPSRIIQVWAEPKQASFSDGEKVPKDRFDTLRSDTLVASPEIESQPFQGAGCLASVDLDFSSITDKFNEEHLWPTSPEQVNNDRYDKRQPRPRCQTQFTIQPMTITFQRDKQLPYGWAAMQHPEGALYFFHVESRAFTDVDLYDGAKAQQICLGLQAINDACRARSIDRRDVDTVLSILDFDPDDIWTGYYFAKHSTRSIFFLHPVDLADYSAACLDVMGAECPAHIEHEVHAQYWTHCTQYPNSLALTTELANEFKDTVTYYMGDVMLSRTSTVPYTLDELERMLALANHIRKNTHAGTNLHGTACVLSGFMTCFTRNRFYNFHGQHGARLERDRSVHGEATCNRSWIIKTLSPLLFCAPDVHLRGMEKIWIDNKLSQVWWNSFMAKLYTEWQEFVLYGTVLLNANVAFLAIQSVDEASEGPARSSAQIASYASVIASMGCIIVGLVLIRSNRSKAKETALDAAAYMNRICARPYGLEMFSIMCSLPYALLMWATVAFLAAFVLMVFEDSDIYTRVLLGVASFVLACLITWCVYMQWEKRAAEIAAAAPPETDEPKKPVGQFSKLAVPIRRMSSSLKWPAFLQRPRRSTVDSDQTAV